MFKERDGFHYRNKLKFTKEDKWMIREIITNAFVKTNWPKGLTPKLTRINWSSAYQIDNTLKICYNISLESRVEMDYCTDWSSWIYTSQKFFLEIPFSHFRNYRLEKLLGE
jgi:hypothetical protein